MKQKGYDAIYKWLDKTENCLSEKEKEEIRQINHDAVYIINLFDMKFVESVNDIYTIFETKEKNKVEVYVSDILKRDITMKGEIGEDNFCIIISSDKIQFKLDEKLESVLENGVIKEYDASKLALANILRTKDAVKPSEVYDVTKLSHNLQMEVILKPIIYYDTKSLNVNYIIKSLFDYYDKEKLDNVKCKKTKNMIRKVINKFALSAESTLNLADCHLKFKSLKNKNLMVSINTNSNEEEPLLDITFETKKGEILLTYNMSLGKEDKKLCIDNSNTGVYYNDGNHVFYHRNNNKNIDCPNRTFDPCEILSIPEYEFSNLQRIKKSE